MNCWSGSTLAFVNQARLKWGWSEDEIKAAIKKQPYCMMASEKKIMAMMDVLVNQMGYSSSLVVERPSILMLSLEKRIIPRCLVIRILVAKGLIKKKIRITTILTLVEETILKRYVIEYKPQVPELLKVYQGSFLLPKGYR